MACFHSPLLPESFVVVFHHPAPRFEEEASRVEVTEFTRCGDAFHAADAWIRRCPGREVEVWLDRRLCLLDTVFSRRSQNRFTGPLRAGAYECIWTGPERYVWRLSDPQAGSGAVAMGEQA
jgi:hypothetical protein